MKKFLGNHINIEIKKVVFIQLILLISLIYPSVSFSQQNNTTEIKVIEEKLKSDEEKFQIQLNALDDKREQEFKCLKDELVLRHNEMEKRINIYAGILTLVIALVSLLGVKTILKWIRLTIRDKTDEEVRKYLAQEYIEKLIKEKSEEPINKLVDEVKEKAKSELDKIQNIRLEYENSLNHLKEEGNKVWNVSQTIPNNVKEDLRDFVNRLVEAKSEEKYTFNDWFYNGINESQQKKYRDAAISFEKAHQKKPNDLYAIVNAAISFASDNNLQKAEEWFKKALTIAPNDPTSLGAYAVFLFNKKKDHIQAEEYFGKALSLNLNDPVILESYAIFLQDYKRDYPQAELYLEKALKEDPNNAHILGTYGFFMFEKERYPEALDYTEKSLKINMNNWALFNKGHILLAMNKIPEAEQVYREAFKMVNSIEELKNLALDDLNKLKDKGVNPKECERIIKWLEEEFNKR